MTWAIAAATLFGAATDAITDPKLPTKICPLFIKVECLPAASKAVIPVRPADRLEATLNSGYDFQSNSPGKFVEGLETAVAKARRRLALASENRGKFNVRCVIKLLVIEGESKCGIGGSVTTGSILSDDQILRLQNLMAADATVFWVACMSMTKNGTTQVLQRVLSKNGGTFVGFKSYGMEGCSFPRQLGQDEVYPAALKIKRGASAAELRNLFNRAGQPVAGDNDYYRDTRFPGETDPVIRAYYEVAEPNPFPKPDAVKAPTIDELVEKPTIIPAKKS